MPRGIWLLLVGLIAACGSDGPDDRRPLLRPGVSLGHGVTLTGSRTYPVEPMSPTSGRCAVRLDHRASGAWTEVFPVAGWQRPARFLRGDVHFADGRQRKAPPGHLAPAFSRARQALGQRVAGLTGDQLVHRCRAWDDQRPGAARFWLPACLALLLLGLGLVVWRRSGWAALGLALAGVASLLVATWPVLGGESFGSQEVQRLLSSLRPWGELWRGDDGDARHPAGLYLVYRPVAGLWPTVWALRLYGWVLLTAASVAWVVARWRRQPAEVLVVLALLVHPLLVKNSFEVGPYAFYTAGLLGLWLVVGGQTRLSRLRFGLGLGLVCGLAAVNHVATVVAPAVLAIAVVRGRSGQSRLELGLRLALVLAAMLPFAWALVGALAGEPQLRQAAARTPALAWGSRPFWQLTGGLFKTAFVGAFTVLCVALVPLLGWTGRRTHADGLALCVLGLLTLGGLAALSPWFRVQPYYALYGLVPLVLGLGRLLTSVRLPALRQGAGLLCLALLLLSFVEHGPALARRQAAPRPAVAAAQAIRAQASACPLVLTTTNDLALPLLPHLTDPRRLGRSRPAPEQVGTPQGRIRPLGTTGLTLWSGYARHRLPGPVLDRWLERVFGLSRQGCVQVLYDRRFPQPSLYRRLGKRCRTTADRGPYRLFACGPTKGRHRP